MVMYEGLIHVYIGRILHNNISLYRETYFMNIFHRCCGLSWWYYLQYPARDNLKDLSNYGKLNDGTPAYA